MALLKDEPGADRVEELLSSVDASFEHAAILSSVNLAELHQRFGQSIPKGLIGGAGSVIATADFTARQAAVSGAFYAKTKRAGLSLADRACLALAAELNLRVVTADRAWADVDVGLDVELIR